jgi:hypothetical protein
MDPELNYRDIVLLYCAKAVRLQLRLCGFNAFDYRETPSG